MQNVVLVIHLILAISLVAIILLQRSEGGGLNMGSGGGDIMSSRSAATALGKITWGLAIAFICTSLSLTVIAKNNSSVGSVSDLLGTQSEQNTDGQNLLPPTADDSEPLLPVAE